MSALHVAGTSHSMPLGFQKTVSQEHAFQETLGDMQRFLPNLENHTASLLLCDAC